MHEFELNPFSTSIISYRRVVNFVVRFLFLSGTNDFDTKETTTIRYDCVENIL